MLLSLLKDSQFPFITGDFPNLSFGSQLRPVEFKYISFLSLFWKTCVALCLTVWKSLHSRGESPCDFCLYFHAHTCKPYSPGSKWHSALFGKDVSSLFTRRLSWILPQIPSAPSYQRDRTESLASSNVARIVLFCLKVSLSAVSNFLRAIGLF